MQFVAYVRGEMGKAR